jgi:hypothetical protein
MGGKNFVKMRGYCLNSKITSNTAKLNKNQQIPVRITAKLFEVYDGYKYFVE